MKLNFFKMRLAIKDSSFGPFCPCPAPTRFLHHFTQALRSWRTNTFVAQATNSSPVSERSFLHRRTLPAAKSSVFPRKIMPQLQPAFFLASAKATACQPSRQAHASRTTRVKAGASCWKASDTKMRTAVVAPRLKTILYPPVPRSADAVTSTHPIRAAKRRCVRPTGATESSTTISLAAFKSFGAPGKRLLPFDVALIT